MSCGVEDRREEIGGGAMNERDGEVSVAVDEGAVSMRGARGDEEEVWGGMRRVFFSMGMMIRRCKSMDGHR